MAINAKSGRVVIRQAQVESSAVFSADRRYRYSLTRCWDPNKKTVAIIGLNPSIADEHSNDPTITRCIRYARDWGYGRLIVANLFAFCATHPRDLKAEPNPVGVDNDERLAAIFQNSDLSVLAWGNDGAHQQRSEVVRRMVHEPHCLRINRSGEPAHPLYLPARLKPIPMHQA